MITTSITSKGQVTIPIELRTALDLQPGDKLIFARDNDKVVISKQKDDVSAAFGMLKTKHKVSQKAIQAAIQAGPDHGDN